MESAEERAFVTAIGIKIRILIYYRTVSSVVNDVKTRRVFELLAQGEANLLNSLFNSHQDSEDELAHILVKNNTYADPYLCTLLNSVDGITTGEDALRIALKEENGCLETYNIFMATTLEPHIRAIFTLILNETKKHIAIILEECQRLMNRLDRMEPEYLCA